MSRFRKPITVVRAKEAGFYDDNGNYVNHDDLYGFTAYASVQPLNNNERRTLENNTDGQRYSNVVKVYTDTELYPPLQDTPDKADQPILPYRNTPAPCASSHKWSDGTRL